MIEYPVNMGPMVQGDDYVRNDGPKDDAYTLEGTNQNGVLGAPASLPCPLVGVSIATHAIDAPPLGGFLTTNLHDDNWLDPTKPHISPESQKG